MPIGIPRDPSTHRTPNAGRVGVPRDPTTHRTPNAGRISVPRPVGGSGRQAPSNDEVKFTVGIAMRMGLAEKFSTADAALIEADVQGQQGLDIGSGRKLFAIEHGAAYVKLRSNWFAVDVRDMNWPDARY